MDIVDDNEGRRTSYRHVVSAKLTNHVQSTCPSPLCSDFDQVLCENLQMQTIIHIAMLRFSRAIEI